MGLVEQAQADFMQFTADATNGWALPVTFTAPDSGPVVTVNAICTKHHLGLTQQGEMTNAKKASLTVNEALLTAQGYPTRNVNSEVYLQGHQVQWTDSTGSLCSYVIREWYPDELLGLITCILGDLG